MDIELNQVYNDNYIQQLIKFYNINLKVDKHIHWCEINGDWAASPAEEFYTTTHGFNRTLESIIGLKLIQQARQGNCVIVFSTFQESWSIEEEHIFHETYNIHIMLERWCDLYHIPYKNVAWITGDVSINKRINSKIHVYGFSCYSHELLMQVTGGKQKHKPLDLLPYNQRQFEKEFLCFQRLMKYGRMYLISQLLQKNLLEYGYCSVPNEMRGYNFLAKLKDWYWHLYWYKNFLASHDINIDNEWNTLENIIPSLPWTLDVHDQDNNNCAELDTTLSSIPYYNTTFMSVISETQVEGNGCFISEAAYKAFFYKCPAIWIGQPGMVKQLRDWGFETWDWLFGEEYDEEPYMCNRIEMTVDSLKRAINLPKTPALIEQIHQQCERNYQWLCTEFYQLQSQRLTDILTKISN